MYLFTEKLQTDKLIKVRWFRDFALEKRISHIVYCVDRNEWPVGKSYSAYTGCQGMDLDTPLFETVKHVQTSSSSSHNYNHPSGSNASDLPSSSSRSHSGGPDVITITTDQGGLSKQIQSQMNAAVAAASVAINQQLAAAAAAAVGGGRGGSLEGSAGSTSKKRKRHIAIDVETERAKLHALLNSTQSSSGNYFSVYFLKFCFITTANLVFISSTFWMYPLI